MMVLLKFIGLLTLSHGGNWNQQGGSLPFQQTLKHSSPLQQALQMQIANHTFNKLESLSGFLLFVRGFFQSFAQPHESAARPLQKATHHITGTCTS